MLGEDNQKMSKSRGNVVNPDDIVREHGADALRVYEMFMGPLEVSKPWSTAGISGSARFLERLWAIGEKSSSDEAPTGDLLRLMHRTIRKVGDDTSTLNFNTAISAMMVLSSEVAKLDRVPRELWSVMVRLVAPYAPHLAEELWARMGGTGSVSGAPWPGYDPALCEEDEDTVVVQVNGKLRGEFKAARGASKDDLERTALALPKVVERLAGRTPSRVIVVPGKLVNVVVKD